MATLHDALTWRGMKIVDQDGDKVGRIEDIYLSRQTGKPEWVTVATGLLGTKAKFVPIINAEFLGDLEVRVPFQKVHIKKAPDLTIDNDLTAEEERRLWQHYGRSDDDDAYQGADRIAAFDVPDERGGR